MVGKELVLWAWAGAPWGTMVMCEPKGAHTLLPLQQTTKTWVASRQGEGNLGAHPSTGHVFPWQHGCIREVGQPHQHTHEESRQLEEHKARGVSIQEMQRLMGERARLVALGPQRGTMVRLSVIIRNVDDCSYVRHSLDYKLERKLLRGVCGSYLIQSWNVEMASSLQRVENNSK
jgi:hypothetical protein